MTRALDYWPSAYDQANNSFISAQKRYNEMHGISTANKGNFISDMKDRNYMQPVSNTLISTPYKL